MQNSNELIIFDDRIKITPAELFTADGIDKILREIELKATSFVQDMTTEEGRKHIASIAFKVAKAKTTLDNVGKAEAEPYAIRKKNIDDLRKKIRDTLDKLKDEIRKPLTDWENEEKQRIQLCKDRISEIEKYGIGNIGFSAIGESRLVDSAIAKINELFTYDWKEFEFKAKQTKDKVLQDLADLKEKLLKQEKEKAELELLRKEKEERERKEREAKIAKEAREKAEAEAKRKAEEEKLKAKKREEEIKKEKVEAEARAKEEERKRKEAEKKAIEDKKKAVEEAKRKEREKIEEEKRKEAEIVAKREADENHRKSIELEISHDLAILLNNYDLDEKIRKEIALDIIEAISKNEVRHLIIKY